MAGSNVTSVVNHFPTVNEGFIQTTSAQALSGAATVGLNSAAALTNGSIFVGIIEPGLTRQQVFTGVVDTAGSQITGVKWTRGTNVDHPAGVTVVDYVTGTAVNMIRKGLLVQHAQDGTHTSITASGTLAVTGTTTLTGALTLKSWDGWITPTNTWTYVSASSFKITGTDVTAQFPVGTKIKLTQTTAKYFYVTSTSFSTDTTVNVFAGSDYTLANAAITSPSLSYELTPQGFPGSFNWTPTTWANFTVGNATILAKYNQVGSTVSGYMFVTIGSTTVVSSSPTFTLPVAPSTAQKPPFDFLEVGNVRLIDTGSAAYRGPLLLTTSTGVAAIAVGRTDTSYLFEQQITSAVPFTYGTGDYIYVTFKYDI